LLIYGDQQKTVKNCAQKWVAKQSGEKRTEKYRQLERGQAELNMIFEHDNSLGAAFNENQVKKCLSRKS
jgi:hypothetical protein